MDKGKGVVMGRRWAVDFTDNSSTPSSRDVSDPPGFSRASPDQDDSTLSRQKKDAESNWKSQQVSYPSQQEPSFPRLRNSSSPENVLVARRSTSSNSSFLAVLEGTLAAFSSSLEVLSVCCAVVGKKVSTPKLWTVGTSTALEDIVESQEEDILLGLGLQSGDRSGKWVCSETKGNRRVKKNLRKAWEVAQAPFKNLLMMGFMMWMAGSTVHLFSIGITFSALWQPISALQGVGKVFEPYKDSRVELLGPKLLFIALNLGGLALGVWKLNTLGLLPTHASDWVLSLPPAQYSYLPTSNGHRHLRLSSCHHPTPSPAIIFDYHENL
ncbi:hypothetical protein RHMOL_Rhmol02G0269800 [Rhododendron molle]|uniref:Uncharacterized protein n=1 Tax=Rhododendron molle TaxID=49168 RepID=A0ACC0PWA0_RHOML|nr:hypothetical protein RHMOL_Rhmol02G0269800 [Rhododendron molle]